MPELSGAGSVLTKVGNCRVIDEIGSGGMAVIYKAVQESLNRVVAIKALKTSVLRESSFAIRFEREALSLAQLQHENIVHVYDYFKESDHLFIVMEFEIVVEIANRSDNGITIEPTSKGKFTFNNVPDADATPENLASLVSFAGYEIDGKNVTA